jgi:hypothetical protein
LSKSLILAAAFALTATQSVAQPVYLRITDPQFEARDPIDIPTIYKFRWTTAEGSIDPVEVRHIFIAASSGEAREAAVNYVQTEPNAPEWSSWEPYTSPNVGTSWTTGVLVPSFYVFAVQGRDQNGVQETIDEMRNVIRVDFYPHGNGALLTVTGELIDPTSASVTWTPVTEVSAPAGAPMTFCWIAVPNYHTTVAGYRYQWDIADPDNDSLWEMPFTPLPPAGTCSAPRAFPGGRHRIDIEVIDSNNIKSRVPIVVNMSPVSTALSTWGSVKALYRSP